MDLAVVLEAVVGRMDKVLSFTSCRLSEAMI